MNDTETLEEFYKQKIANTSGNTQKAIGDFNAFVVEDVVNPEGAVTIKYARRDFYKICLITGSNLFHYADKTIKIDGTCLIFFNPQTPYKWESLSKENVGFFCIFKDAFYTEKLRGNLTELPMFTKGGSPSYLLNEQQTHELSAVFSKIIKEVNSDYKFKQDLLVSYVTEIVHFAMKMEPTETLYHQVDAKSRITSVFSELLDSQFPITSADQRFSLRSARDFAERLYVHVNYLNHAIKETTGKTTSNLIAERLAIEAKTMLKHTDWNVSEIGYSLGFEDASHFNNFFKRHTDLSPSKYRVASS